MVPRTQRVDPDPRAHCEVETPGGDIARDYQAVGRVIQKNQGAVLEGADRYGMVASGTSIVRVAVARVVSCQGGGRDRVSVFPSSTYAERVANAQSRASVAERSHPSTQTVRPATKSSRATREVTETAVAGQVTTA